jgi:hypothetical protein
VFQTPEHAHSKREWTNSPSLTLKRHNKTRALQFTLESILRQKKNYGSYSNISPCKKNIIFIKKFLLKKPKSFKILL